MMTRFLWGCWIKPDREYQVLLGNPEFDEIRRISNDFAGFVLAGDSGDVKLNV